MATQVKQSVNVCDTVDVVDVTHDSQFSSLRIVVEDTAVDNCNSEIVIPERPFCEFVRNFFALEGEHFTDQKVMSLIYNPDWNLNILSLAAGYLKSLQPTL